MYPYYFDINAAMTPELAEFEADSQRVGLICTLDEWLITAEWTDKFRTHLAKLLPQAESGNPLAQYAVASIYMLGYCHTSIASYEENHLQECSIITYWLIRAARQGVVAAVDNLLSFGVGPEVERVLAIFMKVDAERRQGIIYPIGETWRRAYGTPVPENSSMAQQAPSLQSSLSNPPHLD